MKKILIIINIFILISVNFIFSKRTEPKKVEPVLQDGVIYYLPKWGSCILPENKLYNHYNQNGGFVAAFDLKNQELVWVIQVYKTDYDLKIEQDIQDIFISQITIKKDILYIIDEKNRKYSLNIKTKKVKLIK